MALTESLLLDIRCRKAAILDQLYLAGDTPCKTIKKPD
jgi:hypothetical protein